MKTNIKNANMPDSYSEKDNSARTLQRDALTFLFAITGITALAFMFNGILANPDVNITMFYIVGIIVVARYTNGYVWGFLFSLLSVMCVNYFFTYPYFTLNLSLEGYPITFAAMFVIYIITSAMTSSMKEQSRILAKQEKELMEIQKEKMRANLLRAISHDLRTPLTGIIGNSSSYLKMEKELSDADKHDIVENINEDAEWLLSMVENLLSVTRINGDTAKVNKSMESVDEVVASAVTRFKKQYPQAQIKISLPDDIVMAMMDPLLIDQVITNILQNAQVHASSTKPLELTVTDEPSSVSFCVRDYGVGISQEKIETIFDGVGYRRDRDTSADGYKGMGIGLSICKTIINAHGGKINARNHGDGSEFYFSLPKETEE